MTDLVKVSAGVVVKYPYSVGDLKRDNPHTSFPKKLTDEILRDFNAAVVTKNTKPAYSQSTQRLVDDVLPINKGNVWEIGYSVVSKNIAEQDTYKQESKRALDRNYRKHMDKDNNPHWTTMAKLKVKSGGGKKKAKDIEKWADDCLAQYSANVSVIDLGGEYISSMDNYPDSPYTTDEALKE